MLSSFLFYIENSPTTWLYIMILHFLHDRSNWSSPFFSSTTFQNFSCISDIFSEVSNFQHLKKLCCMCSNLLHSSWYLVPFSWWKYSSLWWILLWSWINFRCISCIIYSNIYLNKMQRYTLYFIWKLLYMFRVVPPPIIRSANNCIYSIWYLSHRYCYLPL